MMILEDGIGPAVELPLFGEGVRILKNGVRLGDSRFRRSLMGRITSRGTLSGMIRLSRIGFEVAPSLG